MLLPHTHKLIHISQLGAFHIYWDPEQESDFECTIFLYYIIAHSINIPLCNIYTVSSMYQVKCGLLTKVEYSLV